MKLADSFISTQAEGNKTRTYCFSLNKQALIMCGLTPLIIRAPLLTRYLAAENSAKSEYYVLSDDDVIPMCPDALLNLLEAIKSKPEIGMLGMSYKRLLEKKDLGDRFKKDLGGGIYEVDYVKGIRVIKRGLLPLQPHEWDKLKSENDWGKFRNKSISDNVVVAAMIRDKGMKVAMDTNNYYHDLGVGYSTLIQDNFKTYEIYK